MFAGMLPKISTLAEESYLDATTADVNFIFKIGHRKKNKQVERISAHKILLKFRSDVFDAMFYGQLMEKGDVYIVDATTDAFKEFLKIFYFDQPKFELAYVPGVLQLIRKYNVIGCLDYCDKFLEQSITLDNVCWIYNLALEFQLQSTKKLCEEKISLGAAEIFPSSDFLDRSYETVLQIVSLNNFACDEYDIFKACITWTKEECRREGLDTMDPVNLRNQLQGMLYQIRFRSMDSTHLGDLIREYHSLFNSEELVDIALLALSHSNPKTLISNQYRKNAWNSSELLPCDFFIHTESRMKELKRSESVTFLSNEHIILRQIRLGSLYVNKIRVRKFEPANLKLQIIKKLEDNGELVVYNTECSNESLKFGEWFTLPKMIFIEPLINYEICLDYWDITDNKYYAKGRGDSSVVVIREVGDIYRRRISDTSTIEEGYLSHVLNRKLGDFFDRKKITINISGSATSIAAMKLCKT